MNKLFTWTFEHRRVLLECILVTALCLSEPLLTWPRVLLAILLCWVLGYVEGTRRRLRSTRQEALRGLALNLEAEATETDDRRLRVVLQSAAASLVWHADRMNDE